MLFPSGQKLAFSFEVRQRRAQKVIWKDQPFSFIIVDSTMCSGHGGSVIVSDFARIAGENISHFPLLHTLLGNIYIYICNICISPEHLNIWLVHIQHLTAHSEQPFVNATINFKGFVIVHESNHGYIVNTTQTHKSINWDLSWKFPFEYNIQIIQNKKQIAQ